MKVKDVFPISNGVFAKMDFDFTPLNKDNLDLILLSKCGKREVTPIVEMLSKDGILSDDSLQKIADMIIYEYGYNWQKVNNALMVEYSPLENAVYHEEECTDIDGETGDSVNEINKSDVSAFDQPIDEYTSNNKAETETQNKGTEKKNVKRTLDRTANGTGLSNSQLIKSELALRESTNYSNQIINDVKNYISLALY